MFQTVLFDIDGVMLSEERYFDASALTVWELLTSPQYLGATAWELKSFRTNVSSEEIQQIRRTVFVDDAVFYAMKQRGINANWDMVYLQTACQISIAIEQWIEATTKATVSTSLEHITRGGWNREAVARLGHELRTAGVQVVIDFPRYLKEFESGSSKADLFATLDSWLAKLVDGGVPPFSADKTLWRLCADTFQEWYLGDEYAQETHQAGKSGFLKDEVPIVDVAALNKLFADLRDAGCTIGIGTGRPSLETKVPLSHYGWLEMFDLSRVSTASDVLAAEQAHPTLGPLSKPHPFSYLRSYLGTSDVDAVLAYSLPIDEAAGKVTLVVGDSIADLLAARAIGCKFAAVLTGLEGVAARAQFEQMGADYIFENVLGIADLID